MPMIEKAIEPLEWAGFASSLYTLHEKIGEGGMGVVYRATHRLTGKQVALKRIRSALQSRQQSTLQQTTGQQATGSGSLDSVDIRLSLAREFQTLASLHHPHIVSVLDYGFDAHQNPFYTMELLESPETILDAGVGRSTLGKVELLVQLLQALAYLHRRGILHRDIKPSNVLTVNGQVKLVDFGIADAIGAHRRIAGTIEYMAPELFQRCDASEASDLYAVGLVASQLLTNHFPHDVTSRTRLLSDRLGSDYHELTLDVEMSELIAGWLGTTLASDQDVTQTESVVSRQGLDSDSLDAAFADLDDEAQKLRPIISQLIVRDPEERYQDANEVIRALATRLGQPLLIETSETRESYLQAATFVGREAELATLSQALEEAQAGRGSIWMLSGESGVGKSRLTSELRTRALVKSALVLKSQGRTELGANYQLWAPIVRNLCLYTDPSAEEIGVLLDVAPDLESLLQKRSVAPQVLSPQLARARLHTAIENLFRKQTRLIAVLLEDLHWASTESLELLSQLSPILATLPVLIIGNYRDDEASEALRTLPGTKLLRLSRLQPSQIAQLSESMLGLAGRNPILVDYLNRQTEGNVFFLVETVRVLAKTAGRLDLIDIQALPDRLLSDGMQLIIERRLAQVPTIYQDLLSLAAVAGRLLDLKVMQRASGRGDLNPFLISCANASVLDTQDGVWQFAHDKIRERLLFLLDPATAVDHHRQVAEAIIAEHGEGSGYDAVLAYHFEHGQVPGRAFGHYLRAAAAAARLNSVVEARGHYAAALRTLSCLPTTAETLRQRIDVTFRLISISQWMETSAWIVARLEEVEDLVSTLEQRGEQTADDHGRRMQAHMLRGRTHYLRAENDQALQWFARLRDQAQERGDEPLRAMAINMSGHTLAVQGHLGVCWACLVEAEQSMRKRPSVSPSDLARVFGFQGISLVGRGQIAAGLSRLSQGIDMLADRSVLSTLHGHHILAFTIMEDWSRIREHALHMVTLTREAQDERMACSALGFLGWAESWLGDRESSAQHRLQSRSLRRKYQSVFLQDWFMMADVDAALCAREPATALELLAELIEIAKSAGGVFSQGIAHRAWARALMQQSADNWDQAQSHLQESSRLLELGEIWTAAALTHLVWAELAHEVSDLVVATHRGSLALAKFEAAGMSEALSRAQRLLELAAAATRA